MPTDPKKPADPKPAEEVSLGGQRAAAAPRNEKDEQPVRADEDKPNAIRELAENATTDAELVDGILRLPQDEILPWEDAKLPSKGLYYGWSSGVIQVRPWGANIDRILATTRLAQTGQSIDRMLETCCKFPDGFDPTQLLVGDQVFLLYYLRGITHGNEYEFIVHCPSEDCGAINTNTIDLNGLADTIAWADEAWQGEPFRVSLPFLSKQAGRDVWVEVRFLRVADSQLISRTKKTRARASGGKVSPRRRKRKHPREMQEQAPSSMIPLDDTLTQHLEKVIVSVMGTTDQLKIRSFVDRMHSSDLAVIREWLADHSPGIETQLDLECSACGNDFRVMLPITESFFRPTDSGGVR